MKDLHRRYPALLLLLAGVLLAAFSFWGVETMRRSGEQGPANRTHSEPDYYVENFNFVKVAANGDGEYMISGEKLVHYPDDDSNRIIKPFVKSYSAQRPPMTLQAHSALLNKDHSRLHLYDDVRIERPQTHGAEKLTVESEYMLVLPDDDIIKTDKHVVLTLGNAILSGTGMIADNVKHQFTLQSKVSGSYPPKSKQ